jgi:hypothetical protein
MERTVKTKMLRRNHDRIVKIRPPVNRRFPSGQWLESVDDDWRIDGQGYGQGAVVRLHNQATGHFVDIYPDGVQEFREPGLLILKEQLAMVGRTVQREALPDLRLAYAAAARLQPPPR